MNAPLYAVTGIISIASLIWIVAEMIIEYRALKAGIPEPDFEVHP